MTPEDVRRIQEQLRRGFGCDQSSQNESIENIANQWRREYYSIDGQVNALKRAVQMHPEKYVMGFQIPPNAYYMHELSKAKYEMGLELKQILQKQKENSNGKKKGTIRDA